MRAVLVATLSLVCGACSSENVDSATAGATHDTGALADSSAHTDADAAPADSIADTSVADSADDDGGTEDAATTEDAPDEDTPPPPFDPTAAQFVGLDVCASSMKLSKLIFNMSEPMSTLAPHAITVWSSGASCSDAFNSMTTSGSYAYGSGCTSLDPTRNIVVTVADGVTSQSGKPLTKGVYVFKPLHTPGTMCGETYHF